MVMQILQCTPVPRGVYREPGSGLGGQTKGRRRDREGEETRQIEAD